MDLNELINKAFDEPLFDKTQENSAAFDKASYMADGGDQTMDSRRELFYDRDKAKDKSLWDRAVEESRAGFDGKVNLKFVVWLYQRNGGKF